MWEPFRISNATDLCASDATPAARLIADEIAGSGPISVHRFMELALYHPTWGHYARATAGPGPAGDYLTSPEVHPGFGGLICAQFVEMWDLLGRPDPFWLIEGGPGIGTFASDVLSAAEVLFPSFAASLRVAFIEASSALRREQERNLAPWRSRVEWLAPDPEGLVDLPEHLYDAAPAVERAAAADGDAPWRPLGAGCVFANELLDALPVHRVMMTDAGLRERFVTVRDGRFTELDGAEPVPHLLAPIVAGGGSLRVGQLAEVSDAAARWVAAATRLIDRGYLLFLDYGEPADLLYGPNHPRGTLRCYWRQTMNEDVYCRVGEQDLTTHVDLSSVTRAAEQAGASLIGATSQASLLRRLGIESVLNGIAHETPSRAVEWSHRTALAALVDQVGLGALKALVFGKGVGSAGLAGFSRSTPLQQSAAMGRWALDRTTREASRGLPRDSRSNRSSARPRTPGGSRTTRPLS
jgi:SAM-dependent MidA family methyltransferase